MSNIKSKVNDPENYRELSAPFGSEDIANEALTKFYEELGELRKKHKIPDLLAIVKGDMKYTDGQQGTFMNYSAYGNSLNVPIMAAFAFGQTQAEHREMINKLAAGKTKS